MKNPDENKQIVEETESSGTAANIFDEYLNAQQKLILTLVFIVLVIVSIFSLSMEKVMAVIHEGQLESVVYKDFSGENVDFFTYRKIDQELLSNETALVLFMSPQAAVYEEVVSLLNEAEFDSQLENTLYYYPLVYKSAVVANDYQIDQKAATFVYYENGYEQSRLTYEEVADPTMQLANLLNQLSSGSAASSAAPATVEATVDSTEAELNPPTAEESDTGEQNSEVQQ